MSHESQRWQQGLTQVGSICVEMDPLSPGTSFCYGTTSGWVKGNAAIPKTFSNSLDPQHQSCDGIDFGSVVTAGTEVCSGAVNITASFTLSANRRATVDSATGLKIGQWVIFASWLT
jgi:hypothetical protein